jgi:hypothetical protein
MNMDGIKRAGLDVDIVGAHSGFAVQNQFMRELVI